MNITVLLFARFRELEQRDTLTVALASGATIADLRVELAKRWPTATTLLAKSAFAVNNEYAHDSQALHESAEIALIPAVSGG